MRSPIAYIAAVSKKRIGNSGFGVPSVALAASPRWSCRLAVLTAISPGSSVGAGVAGFDVRRWRYWLVIRGPQSSAQSIAFVVTTFDPIADLDVDYMRFSVQHRLAGRYRPLHRIRH